MADSVFAYSVLGFIFLLCGLEGNHCAVVFHRLCRVEAEIFVMEATICYSCKSL